MDGFSFCITDAITNTYISFTEYIFERSVTTPELLLDKVTDIFNEDKNLQGDFKYVNVIHVNNLSTIVPDAYFNKQALKSYLNYNVKTFANDHIVFDELTSINAKNVYIPFVNINNYLFQDFGSFDFEHHSSVLINKLTNYTKFKPERNFFVNVFKKNIDIIVTEKDNLIFYNSFNYTTKEDFIYYILFVAEQLEMNPDEFPLTFLGAIDKSSENYEITYTYVRNINFINISTDFLANSEDFINHSNFLLVS